MEQTRPTSKIQRNAMVFGRIGGELESKEMLMRTAVLQMLNRTTNMFKYNNLPDTIAVKDLETYLQVDGFAIWTKVNDKLYVFYGGLGGVPNAYYLPTIATVANPALKFSKNLKIDEECVVMLNDYYYQGLMPIFNKYANLITEAELSLRMSIINSRVPAIVGVDTDNGRKTAEEFFKKIYEGRDYGVILTSLVSEQGILSKDFYKEHHIKDLIEAIQYLKGSWFNEIGIKSAFNMKREAINEAEATLNEDILLPFVEIMLKCRQDALDKINKMFGTDITVEFDSVWAENIKQKELVNEYREAEIEDLLSNAEEHTEGEEENEDNRDTDNG